VLLAQEVSAEKKAELRALPARLNPFQLGRERSSGRKKKLKRGGSWLESAAAMA